MRIRLINTEADYPMIKSWWEAHGWDSVPVQALPKIGAIVEDDGESVAAAWLYMDNSVGVCWMEWLVSNPEARPTRIVRAVSQIVEFLAQVGKDNNYGVMLTACRQDKLVALYERNGFTKTDEGVTHLIMTLEN